jgi:hypothetical protein
MIETAREGVPQLQGRRHHAAQASTATINDWSAIALVRGDGLQSMKRENLEIYDRVGGGDSLRLRPGLRPSWKGRLPDASNTARPTARWP